MDCCCKYFSSVLPESQQSWEHPVPLISLFDCTSLTEFQLFRAVLYSRTCKSEAWRLIMDVFMKPNNMTAQQAVKQHLMASQGAAETEGLTLRACLYLGHLFSCTLCICVIVHSAKLWRRSMLGFYPDLNIFQRTACACILYVQYFMAGDRNPLAA